MYIIVFIKRKSIERKEKKETKIKKYLQSILTRGDRPVAKVKITVPIVIGSVVVVRVKNTIEEGRNCTNLLKRSHYL
jgi:hypothetical protein